MFENIRHELKKMDQSLGGLSIPIQMPLDDERYFDRQCPSVNCQSSFKVFFEDWKEKVSDVRVFCPICREQAKATEWNTPDQVEYIKQVGLRHIQGLIGEAMSQDVSAFNRRQSPGFIQLSLSYRPGTPFMVVPISAAAKLEQKFACMACGCRYSSLGAAFFCPACGHNSAEQAYLQTVEAVRQSIAALPSIREAVQALAGPDAAENTVRQILENSLVRIVGAFQRCAEGLFDRAPAANNIPRRKNVFQSLGEGSALWRTATGKGYDDLLLASDMADLLRFFQQRHLLAHCEGIVDGDYLNRSGDRSYTAGQRLVIREESIRRALDLVVALTQKLEGLIK
jgi:uncharacterized Zn finger protein (UPF0148 family)